MVMPSATPRLPSRYPRVCGVGGKSRKTAPLEEESPAAPFVAYAALGVCVRKSRKRQALQGTGSSLNCRERGYREMVAIPSGSTAPDPTPARLSSLDYFMHVLTPRISLAVTYWAY